jgi:soluble lytic murein transglycosylase
VTFGVYYLKEQLDTFDNNVYAALAAYNAGPGASSEWYKISNGDPDLFIQAISYDQTQTYVRRIYEQYETYASIYATK